jgi:hypothetical protein
VTPDAQAAHDGSESRKSGRLTAQELREFVGGCRRRSGDSRLISKWTRGHGGCE